MLGFSKPLLAVFDIGKFVGEPVFSRLYKIKAFSITDCSLSTRFIKIKIRKTY